MEKILHGLPFSFQNGREIDALTVRRKEFLQLFYDLPDAARHVALDIQREDGVMDGEPQQKPAVPFSLGERDADAFPVVRGNRPALLFGIYFQCGDQLFSPRPEIFLCNGQTDFGGLRRLL